MGHAGDGDSHSDTRLEVRLEAETTQPWQRGVDVIWHVGLSEQLLLLKCLQLSPALIPLLCKCHCPVKMALGTLLAPEVSCP